MITTLDELAGQLKLLVKEYTLADANITGALILDTGSAISESTLEKMLRAAWEAAVSTKLTKADDIDEAKKHGNYILFVNKDDPNFTLDKLGSLTKSRSGARGIIVVADQSTLNGNGWMSGGGTSVASWLDQIFDDRGTSAKRELKFSREGFILDDRLPPVDDINLDERTSKLRDLLCKHNLLPPVESSLELDKLELDKDVFDRAAAEWNEVLRESMPKFLWVGVVHEGEASEPEPDGTSCGSSPMGLAISLAEHALDMSRIRRQHPSPTVNSAHPGFAIEAKISELQDSDCDLYAVIPNNGEIPRFSR
jgi:hypothetical protein